ncbi:chaperonin 10 Kd subunit [Klebsormidium nitens]|uniref:Protein groES n=1 Tax=Klebsormidium nitens TaxID=105231 RepID=A0A1Y1I345_KLENI|nr:chaperonin 10 Kd subunit [Klebsormidium nitens]|eukprot:GAQ85350.1 chaperonin 10 Kd subunit [Klebsormidium nitens]
MAAAGAKKLVPLLNRVLVEKVTAPAKSIGGVLLPESATKINEARVIAVGPGLRTKDGEVIPVSVKEGDSVLLPEYGGSQVKLGEKEYFLFRDDDLLGVLH